MNQPRVSTSWVIFLWTTQVLWALPFRNQMFQITRPEASTLGDQVNLSCSLPEGKMIEDNVCRFKTPDGDVLKFDLLLEAPSQVVNEKGEVIPGMTGSSQSATGSPNTCELNIASIEEEHFGRWRCIINRDAEITHIGTFVTFNKASDLYVKDVRLPRHVIPIIYVLELQPNLIEEDFTTPGSLVLDFRVQSDEDWEGQDQGLYAKVYLHTKDTLIREEAVVVRLSNDEEIQIVCHEYDLERDFYIVHLGKNLTSGDEGQIELKFTSYLNDYLTGFYRSSYFDQSENVTKFLGVTQFQTHHAREAFPCLDEPDRKAKFNVSIVHSESMIARSNMEMMESTSVGQGMFKTTFEESVPMSSYLLAFFVSDFTFTQDLTNPTFKTWHQKSKSGQAVMSATYGARILAFYEDFFDIDYPLNKTDMAAIPDFTYGAMENWGLIVYRESALLFMDGVSDTSAKERVITVMAHELAHQWFGNLVTLKWWTDMWLNEGFATYTEYHGVEEVTPEIRGRDRMLLDTVQFVLGLDALDTSVPVSATVYNPAFDTFGALIANKGCALLRMMENFLTLETFKRGVSKYLQANSFDNAEMDDLWRALTDAAEEDHVLPVNMTVKSIMDSWTLQAGFPVIEAKQLGNNSVQLSQRRFFTMKNLDDKEDSKWVVPINVAYPGLEVDGFDVTLPSHWLLPDESSINLTLKHKPFILNVQETGFYRVNYEVENWAAIASIMNLNHSLIHELNRAQLLDDALNLARAEQLSYEMALQQTEYLSKEKSYIPWKAALQALSYINLMLTENTSRENTYFKQYLTGILLPLYNDLGFNPIPEDSHMRLQTRKLILTWLCKMAHETSIQMSKERFQSWVASPTQTNPVHPDLRDVVYITGIRDGNDSNWKFLWEKFLTENVEAEKSKLIDALGSTKSFSLLENFMEETLTLTNIRLQDVAQIFRAIGANEPGRRVQFNWLLSNWERVQTSFKERFPEYVVSMIDGFARASNTEQDLELLQEFLSEKTPELGSAVYEVERLVATAKNNVEWIKLNKNEVVEWLKSKTVTTTTTPSTPSSTTSGSNMIYFSLFTLMPLAIESIGKFM